MDRIIEKRIIDTHSFLWFLEDDPHLSPTARHHIEAEGTNYLSVASLWEMAIKVNKGSLILPRPFGSYIPEQLDMNGIELLPIRVAHTALIASLPMHHKDPFDRLIIAQAIIEKIPASVPTQSSAPTK